MELQSIKPTSAPRHAFSNRLSGIKLNPTVLDRQADSVQKCIALSGCSAPALAIQIPKCVGWPRDHAAVAEASMSSRPKTSEVWYRVLEIEEEATTDARRNGMAARTAFLNELALAGNSLTQAWLRPRNAPQTSLCVGFGLAADSRHVFSMPLCLGLLVDDTSGAPRDDWAAHVYAPILSGQLPNPFAAESDAPLPAGSDVGHTAQSFNHIPSGFGLVARPIDQARRERLLSQLSRTHERRIDAAVTYERRQALLQVEARHQLLKRTQAWTVVAWASSDDRIAAERILRRAIADILSARPDVAAHAEILSGRPPADKDTAGYEEEDLIVSTEALAFMLRPPLSPVHGIEIRPRVRFSLSPPVFPAGTATISLGSVIGHNGREVAPMNTAVDSLRRHVLVAGCTGSGKSWTTLHILKQLASVGIPWLVVESAKNEYGRARSLFPGVSVLKIGAADAPCFGINPLEPEPGFSVHTHRDLLKALFIASFDADDPFPQVIGAALDRVYARRGLLALAVAPRTRVIEWPELPDLTDAALDVIRENGYGPEVERNVSGFVKIRLGSLARGTAGQFLYGGRRLVVEDLMSKAVVLSLDDVGDDSEKRFLMGVVLIRLCQHARLRMPEHSPGLRHVTVIEEAHRLLGRGSNRRPDDGSRLTLATMLTEIRAFGEGLVIVDQSPGALLPEVLKNTATKLMLQLPSEADRREMGGAMSCDSTHLSRAATLACGEAVCSTVEMSLPIRVRMPDLAKELDPHSTHALGTLLSRPAHVGCGGDCDVSPCTVVETRRAQELLQRWYVTLWIELSVASLLIRAQDDNVELAVSPELLGGLRQLHGSRRADVRCAIGRGVKQALQARDEAFAKFDGDRRVIGTTAVTRLTAALDGNDLPRVEPQQLPWGPFECAERIKNLTESSDEAAANAGPMPGRPQGVSTVPPVTAGMQFRLLTEERASYESSKRSFLLGHRGHVALTAALSAATEVPGATEVGSWSKDPVSRTLALLFGLEFRKLRVCDELLLLQVPNGR